MDQAFMKEKKILPLVLSMSLPMVVSMMVNSLYNIVDSFFVAKVSEEAMTALSLVYPVQIVVTAISVGFGVGMNAMIAFFLGEGNEKNANRTTTLGIFFSMIHGLALTVGCIVLMPYFLRLFTKDAAVMELGIRYSNIAFAFSVAVTVGIAFEKVFQAVGRMRISMISMSIGFAANILLDPILIFGMGSFPEMGMAGAALATGIGQVLTLLSYLLFYVICPIPARIDVHDLNFDAAIVRKVYSIGIPAMLNMALPSFLISVLNGILSAFGEAYVLVLGAYYKLQTFIYLPVNGIIQGIRPLVGYNYGAGEYSRVKKIVHTAFGMAVVIMGIGMVLCWSIPDVLMGIFTENPTTVSIGGKALCIISLGFVVSAVSVTSCGALEGLGEGMASLWISLARDLVVILPIAYVLSYAFDSVGVWIAFPVAEFLTALFALLLFQRKTHQLFAADVHP